MQDGPIDSGNDYYIVILTSKFSSQLLLLQPHHRGDGAKVRTTSEWQVPSRRATAVNAL